MLLTGEAGIGKSRLLEALRERIVGQPYGLVRYQCSPHHRNVSMYPVVRQISSSLGLRSGEPPTAQIERLEALIARSGLGGRGVASYLASLLSISTEGHFQDLGVVPSEAKEQTIAALIELFAGLTREAPVFAVLEDAHWIDPTSLDFFSGIVERVPGLRALLIVTSRPEFTNPWVGQGHVTGLALNRFGRRHAAAMIDRITGGKEIPAEVQSAIISKTDGVPLFVEELTKAVLESGQLREQSQCFVLAAPLTALAIPSTLQDSLMARLDRLGSIREIAQIGAAIGREFSYRLLEAISPITGTALKEALHKLVESELVFSRAAIGDTIYVFKHALVQDAAHNSLLRSRRQRIHADIARSIVERFADSSESAPAVIAHHYTEAGLSEPAAHYWLTAAELALSRSALAEATQHTGAGLTAARQIEDEQVRRPLELALLVARANSLLPFQETVAALTSAKSLLDAGVGSDLQRFSVLHGLCASSYFAGKMEDAFALARQIVEFADRQVDPTFKLVAYRLLGTTQVLTGRSREALESLQSAERYRDPDRQKVLSSWFGIDPGLNVLYWKTMALALLGQYEGVAKSSEQVRSELLNHGNAHTVAAGNFCTIVWPQFLFGNLDACESDAVALVTYCGERKVEHLKRNGVLCHACVRARRGPTDENIATIRQALDSNRTRDAHLFESVFVAQLAECLLKAGNTVAAEAAVREGFAFVGRSGEQFWLAELHRLDGLVALKQPQPDLSRVETSLLAAMEVARQQDARMLELRAATDLARFAHEASPGLYPCSMLEQLLVPFADAEFSRDIRDARNFLASQVSGDVLVTTMATKPGLP
ncbi:AAA family ATPase [Mesorhizobium sp. M0816]|uniref:ATP-binding protein n=1 Tax=Mesorhizobium sp. M0816 TaxID=2957006 RepID=UPI003337FD71